MPGYDYQVQLEKNASLVVKNPVDDSVIQMVKVGGHIMKGCAHDKPGEGLETGLRAFVGRADARFFSTLYSFGDFYIEEFQRTLSMKQNPSLPDSGVEISDDPPNEYPKTQYWSMFGIFTLDLPMFPDPSFRLFSLANRQEQPIRLRCRLNKPWGDEIPLRYELLDDEVPLYPWDPRLADFSPTCPITGGLPKPLALLRRDGDQTTMRAAWTAETQTWQT